MARDNHEIKPMQRYKHKEHGAVYEVRDISSGIISLDCVDVKTGDRTLGTTVTRDQLLAACEYIEADARNEETFQARFLGKTVKQSDGVLDLIPRRDVHAPLDAVHLDCSEFTSHCPVTDQPDFAHVTIEYIPGAYLIETKSLKLYLATWRDKRDFNESIACQLCADIYKQLKPKAIVVECTFAARGGISVNAKASIGDVSSVQEAAE